MKNYISQSKGFSLLETLIASSVGLIAIGGMYALFSVNQVTIRTQSNIALAQEQASFVLDVIADDIRKAGWPGAHGAHGMNSPFNRGDDLSNLKDEGTQYDSLIVSRLTREPNPLSADPVLQQRETDCVGNILNTGAIVSHLYYVNPTTQELLCESQPSNLRQAIASNVEAFQVLYGVDAVAGACANVDTALLTQDQNAECLTPTHYVRADQIVDYYDDAKAAAPNAYQNYFNFIKTIRLAVLISTEDDNLIDVGVSRGMTYPLLDMQLTHQMFPNVNFDDGRIRRVAVRTIALRQVHRGP